MPQSSPIKYLFKQKGFKKYFKNTGWLMVSKIVRLVTALLVGLYVARYLAPERYGLLNFALSFVALFGEFGKLGLEWIVTRNAVKYPEQRDELLGTAFGLRIIGGLLMIGLVSIAVQFTGSDRLTKIIVVIIAVSQLLEAFQVIEEFFKAQVQGRLASIVNITSMVIEAATKLVLIWCHASLIWFVWMILVANIIKGILLCSVYMSQNYSLMAWRMRFSQARVLLKDSWPLMLSGMMIMVNMRMDQVMINLILGNEALGVYVPSVRLSEIWYFIPVVITQSIFPAILNAKDNDTLYYARLQGLFSLMIWMAILLAIPISLLSNPIVTFLYGLPYRESGEVLAIYVWAGIPVFFSAAWSKWILAENKQRIVFLTNGVSLVINLVLNLILIKKMGIKGAAWATVISYSASQISGLLIFQRRVSFQMLYRSLFVSTLLGQARAIFRR